MEIKQLKNKIIIYNPKDFDIIQTLNCGQLFRYTIDANKATVYSLNKCATIEFNSKKIEISSSDINYFYNFFDLKTDYSKIKAALKKDKFLKPAIEFGSGIRILNNDLFEMLISFIISANNNIGRIKKSVEYLCTNFGTNCGSYFAFPTLSQLKTASVSDFKLAGLGYRAEQMFETVQQVSELDLKNLKTMSSENQFKFLTSLKGVGEKVANCIMLFGLGVKNVFPVDTWINKVYNDLTNTNETNRKKISRELVARYGNLAGFAQQYAFYYYRIKKIKS